MSLKQRILKYIFEFVIKKNLNDKITSSCRHIIRYSIVRATKLLLTSFICLLFKKRSPKKIFLRLTAVFLKILENRSNIQNFIFYSIFNLKFEILHYLMH